MRALRGHEGKLFDARFSADGKTVLTASEDNTARLLDCAECRPVEDVVREVAARLVGRELTATERLRFGLSSAPSPAK